MAKGVSLFVSFIYAITSGFVLLFLSHRSMGLSQRSSESKFFDSKFTPALKNLTPTPTPVLS